MIKKYKILWKMAACLALAFTFIGGSQAFAEDFENASTITVSPMSQKIILTPGETYEGTIRVSNPATASTNVDYSLHTAPYSVTNEEYDFDLGTESTYTQMEGWITFAWDNGELAPNEVAEIPFYVTVPEDAPAGGQYAAILVRNDTPVDNEAGNVTINSTMQVASVVYALVSGNTIDSGEIIENAVPGFITSTPLTGSFKVKNTGNMHSDCTTTLQVFPLFSDEEVYTNEESPQENLIMPETTRYGTISWDNAPMVGVFRVVQTVSFAGQTSTTERIVVICPIWLLFIIIFIIAVIIIWLIMKVRSRKKAKKSQPQAN